MFNLFKKNKDTSDIRYKLLGFDINVNPHSYIIENLKNLINQLWGKYYTELELSKIQKYLNDGSFDLEVHKDLIFLEYPRPKNEINEQTIGSGSLVNKILPFEHQIYQFTDDEVQKQFNELRDYGIIIGSDITADKFGKTNWGKVSKEFQQRGIILMQQFSWVNVSIYVRNNILTWNFTDIPKIIEEQKEFRIKFDKVKAKNKLGKG